FLPETVRYHALREGRKLIAALEAHWLIANCTVNLAVLALFPLFGELYRYWTAGRVGLDQALLSYMLLSVVIANPVGLITNYLIGISARGAVPATLAARGLAPPPPAAVLLPRLGLAGVGIAVVLGELIGSIGLALPFFRRQIRNLDSVPPVPAWRPVA